MKIFVLLWKEQLKLWFIRMKFRRPLVYTNLNFLIQICNFSSFPVLLPFYQLQISSLVFQRKDILIVYVYDIVCDAMNWVNIWNNCNIIYIVRILKFVVCPSKQTPLQILLQTSHITLAIWKYTWNIQEWYSFVC